MKLEPHDETQYGVPAIPDEYRFLLDGRAWVGMRSDNCASINISESEAHPGFWYVTYTDDSFIDEMKRPIAGGAVMINLRHYELGDFVWSVDAAAVGVETARRQYAERDLQAKAERKNASVVYFLRAGPFIKIGRTAKTLARVAELQTGCPYEIFVVACVRGGPALERSLHIRFADLRARERGEWFHDRGALSAYIKEIA